MVRVKRAESSMTTATGTSQKAMKAKIASGAAMAMATCGMYWPKKLCNCSTPSTMDSITPPVRSAPNQAGPSATILSYSRPRSVSCTRMAVRCATMVRVWSNAARSTMATPAPASGQTRTVAGEPWNTPARNRPRKTKRAMPKISASMPSNTESTMRSR